MSSQFSLSSLGTSIHPVSYPHHFCTGVCLVAEIRGIPGNKARHHWTKSKSTASFATSGQRDRIYHVLCLATCPRPCSLCKLSAEAWNPSLWGVCLVIPTVIRILAEWGRLALYDRAFDLVPWRLRQFPLRQKRVESRSLFEMFCGSSPSVGLCRAIRNFTCKVRSTTGFARCRPSSPTSLVQTFRPFLKRSHHRNYQIIRCTSWIQSLTRLWYGVFWVEVLST